MTFNKTRKHKIAVYVGIIALLLAIFILQKTPFNIDGVQANASLILDYLKQNPLLGTCAFIAFYFLINALPMPFVSLPTILAGYLFGTINALIIVSFTSAIGACCLFLVSRYLLHDWVNTKLSNYPTILKRTNTDNIFWSAVSLRLLPGMPFFVPSIALSCSNISLREFYLSTQLGLLFTLFIFVNAGNQLLGINSVNDIFNISLVFSMLLLALAPFLPNLLSQQFKKRRS